MRPKKIHLVDNVMIDSLIRLLPQAEAQCIGTARERYVLVPLHRPSKVDDLSWLRQMLLALSDLSHDLAVVFPVHPRTRQRIADLGLQALANGHLRLMEPKPKLEFLAAARGCRHYRLGRDPGRNHVFGRSVPHSA